MKTIGDFQFPETPDEAHKWTRRTRSIALDWRVLAVATTRIEGMWCAYIGSVPGEDHREEEADILKSGSKLPEDIARVIFPHFYGVPYAR